LLPAQHAGARVEVGDEGEELGAGFAYWSAVVDGEAGHVALVVVGSGVAGVPPAAQGEHGGVVEDRWWDRAAAGRAEQPDVGHPEFVRERLGGQVQALVAVVAIVLGLAEQDQRGRLVQVGELVLQGPHVETAAGSNPAARLKVEQGHG